MSIDDIKAGKNIELDGVIIDNQTSVAEKAPKVTNDGQEPAVNAEAAAVEEQGKVPEAEQDIPAIPVPEEQATDVASEANNTYSDINPIPSYQNSIESYVKNYADVPTVPVTNININEEEALTSLRECAVQNFIKPYMKARELLDKAVGLLSEIDERGYVTGPNHDIIRGIKAEFGDIPTALEESKEDPVIGPRTI